jgi:hypothetical protein
VCHCLTAAGRTVNHPENRYPAAVKQCHTAAETPEVVFGRS